MIITPLKILLILVFSIVIATFAFSQRQTGSLAGKTVDSEGIPLPGVTVTLSGPAMMGTLSYITSDSGDFRFPSVPPGQNYVITFEMPGFNTLKRGGIIVRVGKTVSLIITMEAAALEEEVTVIAATPTIDVKSSKISVNYSADMIKNVPLARDFYDVIKTAPGIISTDVNFHRTFSSHGGTVRSNQVTMDGVTMNDPVVGTNMVGLPFDVFEEFEFELGAHPAEVGTTEGAFINIVTKSGGNEFHGQAMAYFFNESMSKSLIPDEEAEAVGLSAPRGYNNWGDYSFTLGGPVIKDKFWFFANARYVKFTLGGETFFDGAVSLPHDEIQTFAKLTFKPHPKLQLTAMWSYKRWKEEYLTGWGIDYFQALGTYPSVDTAQDHVIQAMVNWILDQNTFLDFRFNYFHDVDPWFIHPDVDQNTPYTIDIANNDAAGGSRVYNEDYTNPYTKFNLGVTRFLDDFLGGNHEVKVGIEYLRAPFTVGMFKPNPFIHLVANGDPWALGPGVGYFIAIPYGAERGDVEVGGTVRRWSAYLQDSFTIADRLTLNLGFRYDESHGDSPGGQYTPVFHPVTAMLAPQAFLPYTAQDYKDVIVWKFISPRIGVVFDVFGDGTTSLKASWSRYNEQMLIQFLGGLGLQTADALEAVWIDLNGNRQVEITDFFIPQTVPVNPNDLRIEDKLDPNTKSPYTDEFIVGIERELVKDFSLSVSYIYKKKARLYEDIDGNRGLRPDSGWWVPYTVNEPGWDGQFGTADDTSITVFGVKAGAPPQQWYFTNVEGAVRKYQAVEFVFNKRMSDRWQFLGSLTLSKFEGNIGADYGPSSGLSGAYDSPNWLINRYGRLDMDRPVQIKLQGSVLLPLDFMLSAFYFHMSGVPWGRTLRVYFPPSPIDPRFDLANPPYVDVQAEAPGERRLRSRNNLDMRIEKIFNIGSFGRLGVFLDVLNVLGESWFDVEQDPGGWINPDGSFVQWPTFGQHTAVNGLRVFKLSARFTF